MKKACVFLTIEGAVAHKAHLVGKLGGDDVLANGHGSLLSRKRSIQRRPASRFRQVETILPDWDGDLKERAAVGLGHRKQFARFIEHVEIL